MCKVEITRYDHEVHGPQALGLFEHIPYKSLLWNWEYGNISTSVKKKAGPLVAVCNGQIVGFNGVIPVRLYYDGTVVSGAWSCDFYVDPGFRSQGVGKLLKEKLHHDYNIVMASGVSEQAARLHLKLGSCPSNDVRVYRKIIVPASLKDWLLLVYQQIFRIRYRSKNDAQYILSVDGPLPSPEDIDSLWATVQQTYRRTVIRDGAYMTWRYASHPSAAYRYIVARSSGHDLKGILVYRINNDIGYLVDYIGPMNDVGLQCALVKSFSAALMSVKSIVGATSDPGLGWVLHLHGFYKTRALQRFFVKGVDELCGAKNWFLTTGDSDGELLQAARDYWMSSR